MSESPGAPPRRFSTRRRVAVATAAVATFAMGPVTAGLHASASPVATAPSKTPLGSVNVNATAAGLRAPLYSHSGEDVEAEAPYALSQLGAGGTGHAVTSIFWPGSTGAAGGSTLGVLGIKGLPTSLENELNDPYKAEAPTTSGNDTVTMNQGVITMQAVSKPNLVSATSQIGSASNKTLEQLFGNIKASTVIKQNANNVVVDAHSAVLNTSIGGVLSIGSIVSTAHAVSDGTHSQGTISTVVAGLKVAGVNVTVDQNGIAVSGKGLLPKAVLATLSKTVNNALKAAGIRIFLVQGTKQIKGPSVHLDTGVLIVEITKPAYAANFNDTGMVLVFGGASINASASPGYVAPSVPSTSPPTAPAGPSTATGGSGVPPVSSGGAVPPAPAATTSPVVAVPPQLAPAAFKLPGGLAAGWVILGLILAGLFAFGMKRLPDRVLEASGPGCRLEEGS